jgi:LacI family transcriptional regulator
MWPKISDVAKEAGVSLSTVSRVLNNTKQVSPELKERVLKAVEKLDYQPNQHARWLSSRRSNVIGIIMPSGGDSNLADYLHACSVNLRSNGFEIMVGLSGNNKYTERDLISAHIQSHVSGILFTSYSAERKIINQLTSSTIPILCLGNDYEQAGLPSLSLDNRTAAKVLVERIQLENYRKVAIISGVKTRIEMQDRIQGSIDALSENGLQEPLVIECREDSSSGRSCVAELLDTSTPDLILCMSDYLAVGAMRAIHEKGITIPDDVAVTGFGRNIYSEVVKPSLTTVEFDGKELGRLAAETMIKMINGRKVPRSQRIGFSVVEGESCRLVF